MSLLEPNLLLLVAERRTYAPGDKIWVNITLQRPSAPPPYTGTVALCGDERSTLLNGQTQSVQVFEPVIVQLEPSQEGVWHVALDLPADIPPSCDLGAIPPSGLIMYVLTAKLNKTMSLDQSTCTRKIKVVSMPQMAHAKEAELVGFLLPPKRQPISSYLLMCGGKRERTEDANGRLGSEDMAFVRECCLQTRTSNTTDNRPEFRVTVPGKTSIRCGEHLNYRVDIRGLGPSGKSTSSHFAKIKAIRVWIRRTRMFCDGNGQDNELQDVAKQAQWIDFVGGLGGVLPVGFESQIAIPLGMAPTVRGSLVTNEYDLIVEVLNLKNKVIGTLDVPITVWRDVEGNLSQPAFSPTLRSTKAAKMLIAQMPPMLVEVAENSDRAVVSEDDAPLAQGGRVFTPTTVKPSPKVKFNEATTSNAVTLT